VIDNYITVLGQTTSYYNCSITKHKKFKIKKRISKRKLIQKYKLKFIKHYKYFDRKLYNIFYNNIKNNK
jgi:hypothetical protein